MLAGALAAALVAGGVRADLEEAEEAWADGRTGDAGQLLRSELTAYPELAETARGAELLALTEEDPAKALAFWDLVLNGDPDRATAIRARRMKGIHAYSAGLYVAAAAEFALLAGEPAGLVDRGEAFLWKGRALLGANEAGRAAEAFEQAEDAASQPAEMASARFGRAFASFHLGNLVEAQRRFDRFEGDYPHDPRASAAARQRVECLRLLGRERDARTLAAEIERNYPASPEATMIRGDLARPFETKPPEDEETGDRAGVPHQVQVAALADPRNVVSLRQALLGLGLGEVRVEPGQGSRGPVHRVFVGPFPSREDALAAADSIRMLGGLAPTVSPAAP